MRLFAALPLSPAAVERLTRIRLRLSAPGDGLRWSTQEQWHITLQFYGEVERGCVECLQQAFKHAGASFPRPTITIGGLEMFAAKGILLASAALTPTLLELREHVLRCGIHCGVESESRPFRPHITLACSKGKAGTKTLQRLGSPSLPSFGSEVIWQANEILLIESTLRPQGAEYTLRGRISLAPARPLPQGGA